MDNWAEELESRMSFCIFRMKLEMLNVYACCHIETEWHKRIHLKTVSYLRDNSTKHWKLTLPMLTGPTILITSRIWCAAALHLNLLWTMGYSVILFHSALNIAAWWRHITAVWRAMLQKIILGSPIPMGRRRWVGMVRAKWSKISSHDLCRCQKPPVL